MGPTAADPRPKRFLLRPFLFVFHDKGFHRRSSTHRDTPLRFAMLLNSAPRCDGEPFAYQTSRFTDPNVFEFGDKRDRVATSIAIAEALPKTLVGIDDKLFFVRPVMDWANRK